MKNRGKYIRNILLFILLIFLTFAIVFKDESVKDIFQILKSVKIQYVFIGILCMSMYIILEAVNIGRTLKVLNE